MIMLSVIVAVLCGSFPAGYYGFKTPAQLKSEGVDASLVDGYEVAGAVLLGFKFTNPEEWTGASYIDAATFKITASYRTYWLTTKLIRNKKIARVAERAGLDCKDFVETKFSEIYYNEHGDVIESDGYTGSKSIPPNTTWRQEAAAICALKPQPPSP